jgi:hypothetical protein
MDGIELKRVFRSGKLRPQIGDFVPNHGSRAVI